MSRNVQIVATAAAIVVCAVGWAAFSLHRYRSRPENRTVVPMGEEIRYDDFAFSVVRSREATGPDRAHGGAGPGGRFVVVTMRVSNHARRVGFTFRPSAIRLVAADGREYAVAAGVPVVACEAELPPGATCTAELTFEVPADAGPLRARVGSSFTPFDLLDRLRHGPRELALD